MSPNKLFLIFIFLVFITFKPIFAQTEITGIKLESYPFINTQSNQFNIIDSANWVQFFSKLSQVSAKGKGKVSIVHMGDSHLQADYFPGALRKQLQTYFLGTIGGRGFIFPYKIANTNNPVNYSVHWRGNWENCRSIEKNRSCKLGLSGIAITTADSNARINIGISDPSLPYYDFDRLIIFHEVSSSSFTPVIAYPGNPCKTLTDSVNGFTLFEFNQNVDSVCLLLKKTNPNQNSFTLYGMNFDSNDPGIIYHTIGINGASIESYRKCDYFTQHLQTLTPDLVIVSLGTNDSYTNSFDTLKFKSNVVGLINSIREAAPNCAIIFTTPGDNLFRKRYVNQNTRKASNIMIQLAHEANFSYWNFNHIMGEPGSVKAWRTNGLAHTDFVHLTRKGYEYQASLFFSAFIKAYGQYLSIDPLTNAQE